MSTEKRTTRKAGNGKMAFSDTVTNKFVASREDVAKAKQLRLFAILAWLVAIGLQVYAIFGVLFKPPVNMTLLIILIAICLVLAITASILWKKSNRLDPASEKDKVKFFLQNQLGAIMGILAFLPLVILIFTNKDLTGKQKGLVGSIAVVAMLIAGITGIDFDPPSIEKYTQQIEEQTRTLKTLNADVDNVFWTRAGNKYHIYEDCQHIRGREEINNGTVQASWDEKGISELCKTCQNRAMRDRNISEEDIANTILDEGTE
jgi:hypothetical protein